MNKFLLYILAVVSIFNAAASAMEPEETRTSGVSLLSPHHFTEIIAKFLDPNEFNLITKSSKKQAKRMALLLDMTTDRKDTDAQDYEAYLKAVGEKRAWKPRKYYFGNSNGDHRGLVIVKYTLKRLHNKTKWPHNKTKWPKNNVVENYDLTQWPKNNVVENYDLTKFNMQSLNKGKPFICGQEKFTRCLTEEETQRLSSFQKNEDSQEEDIGWLGYPCPEGGRIIATPDFNGAIISYYSGTKSIVIPRALRGVVFNNIKAEGVQWHGLCFKWTSFANSQLRKINMDGMTLSACKFKDCDFEGAKMIGINLKHCIFENCDLREVDLSKSTISKDTQFINVNMTKAALQGVKLKASQLLPILRAGANPEGIIVKRGVFKGCDFKNLNLKGLTMQRVCFDKCDFTNGILFNAEECNFKDTIMTGAKVGAKDLGDPSNRSINIEGEMELIPWNFLGFQLPNLSWLWE